MVDDHVLFASALANLLASNGLNVVATARDGMEARDMVRKFHPDIVLMDVRMPNCNGLEATRLIKEEFPTITIIMLTMDDQDSLVAEAIEHGASGYLLKNIDEDTLLRSLHDFSPAGSIATNRASDEDALLTPRQREVLALVAEGLAYKEIASELRVTESTVKYHMKEILQRLDLDTRAQAMAYALKHRYHFGAR